jgi:hypothetical protein
MEASITQCDDTRKAYEQEIELLAKDETIRLLGEVVGISGVDPNNHQYFCQIAFGRTFRHQTGSAEEGGIWSLSKKSLFWWDATPRELALDPLEITVRYQQKDPLHLTTWDTGLVGHALVNGDAILASPEEHMDIQVTENVTLTMRFRLATDSDIAFLTKLYRNDNPWREAVPTATLVTEANEWKNLGRSVSTILQTMVQNVSNVYVKPHADPQRVEQTTYMSKEAIKETIFAPSQHWVTAGSGSIGHLYLEVLKCSDLPNVDIGGSIGNLTDCFVCAVFEDAMVQTPVIDDELSPHWMPWTQRAFCIKIMHPSSLLYLGAFDFDCLGDHDPLGRVVVNLSNLQRNTEYTLTYNLYPNSHVTDRISAGQITVRIRLEYFNEREALVAGIRSRPKFHVNVEKEKSFKVLHYTCHGEFGDHTEQGLDITIVRSYINEILEYKNTLGYCMVDSIQSLIFWRGQVQVFEMVLPLHSLVFFLACSKLLERPSLFPAFCFLGVGWIMLITLMQRRQHPSPWFGCPSFQNYLQILLVGETPIQFERIEPFHLMEQIDAHEKAWRDRVERDQKHIATLTELQQKLNAIGDEAIHTKQANISIPLDLLERLSRYQGIIAKYCHYMRVVKILVTWEEGVISFWITAGFLVAGLVSLLLPWEFILTWSSKIIVYGLLGPHMMVVDSCFGSLSHDDKISKAIEKLQNESKSARHRRQDALKLKDAKCLAFGTYITQVPSFNISRHHDRPLPCSHAEVTKILPKIPCNDQSIPGQQFFGRILPRTEVQQGMFKKEWSALEKLRMAAQYCVREIMENESSDVVKALRKKSVPLDEREVPESMGFEIVDGGLGSAPYIYLHNNLEKTKGLRRRRQSSLLRIDDSSQGDLHRKDAIDCVSTNDPFIQSSFERLISADETAIELHVYENSFVPAQLRYDDRFVESTLGAKHRDRKGNTAAADDDDDDRNDQPS